MSKIMVIGYQGQLARSFRELLEESKLDFRMFPKEELDITDKQSIRNAFDDYPADFCINCAAYTAVDKAEKEEDKAFAVNSQAVFELGEACRDHNCLLIHFSTDYVYHNGQDHPLKETDPTKPVSVYGKSKREGEKALSTIDFPTLIFRVSWLYAPWGNNFIQTMLQLSNTQKEIRVVYDQIGTPTYAPQLANDILHILYQMEDKNAWKSYEGIYNYSQEGVASWYDIARKIFKFANIDQKVTAVTTEEFPRPAERPFYSVLSKEKIKSSFQLELPHWEDQLKTCIQRIQND